MQQLLIARPTHTRTRGTCQRSKSICASPPLQEDEGEKKEEEEDEEEEKKLNQGFEKHTASLIIQASVGMNGLFSQEI